MALTKAVEIRFDSNYPSAHYTLDVAAGAKIYAGAAVAASTADAFVRNALGSDPTLFAFGYALETVDNTGGAAGAKKIHVRTGGFVVSAASAKPGQKFYFTDENTLTATATANTRNAVVISAVPLVGASALTDLRTGEAFAVLDGTRIV